MRMGPEPPVAADAPQAASTADDAQALRQLRERIVELYDWVSQYGGRPTQSLLDRIPLLEKEIDAKNAEFEAIIGKELAGVNAKLAGKKLDPIKMMTKEEYDKKQEK